MSKSKTNNSRKTNAGSTLYKQRRANERNNSEKKQFLFFTKDFMATPNKINMYTFAIFALITGVVFALDRQYLFALATFILAWLLIPMPLVRNLDKKLGPGFKSNMLKVMFGLYAVGVLLLIITKK